MTIYSLDILFPNLEPVCCSMSSSKCCFLICMQISQEAGQVVCYFYLLRIFHSLLWSTWSKALVNLCLIGIVNQAEIDIFWNSLAFLMIQQMLATWFLVPLPFLKVAWTSGSSHFTYCWSLAWRILSITLLECAMSAIVERKTKINK